MLAVRDVTSGYGNHVVLRDVSLSVEAGEMVALLGPNGAGKSTLIKTIVGVVRPMRGEILVEDSRIDRRRPDEIVRMGVSLVPEGRRIFTNLTVRENLLLAAKLQGDRARAQEDIDFVFDLFPILKERSSSSGNALSGGQQQMLALARAVVQRPSIVLLDEPSIGLSPLMVQQLPKMISGVQQRTNAAVLLVEQDAGVALALAARGYVLRAGRIVLEGTAGELANSSVLLEGYLGADADSTTR